MYDRQEWKDLPIRETPIMSERLLHIEQGIYDNSALIADIQKKLEPLKSYENLENKPSINGVELLGDVPLDHLGITDYIDKKVAELELAVLGGES